MDAHPHDSAFCHAALFYAGDDGYVDGLVPFIRDGLDAGEPTLVMVPGRKTGLLREALGPDAAGVHFADMTEVGANPARIIPAWREFVSDWTRPGRRLRGIGEPIWADRSPAELVECQRHEALLNLAFPQDLPMDLVCPYDEVSLEADVIEEALRSHPVLLGDGGILASSLYEGVDKIAEPFDHPLPPPPADAAELEFDGGSLDAVRGFVSRRGRDAGLDADSAEALMLAVNELASNSVRHAGGGGVLRMWPEGSAVIAEVSDRGRIDAPLAGRELPAEGAVGGHGLWLVNQLCDLMQVRTFDDGSVVRLHVKAARE